MKLRAFSRQGTKIGHECQSWGSGGGLGWKGGHGNEEDTEKRRSKLIYRVKYSEARAIDKDKVPDAFSDPN